MLQICWHYISVGFLQHTALLIFQVGAFSVLKELVVVLPDCLSEHIGSLTPGIEKALCVGLIPFRARSSM